MRRLWSLTDVHQSTSCDLKEWRLRVAEKGSKSYYSELVCVLWRSQAVGRFTMDDSSKQQELRGGVAWIDWNTGQKYFDTLRVDFTIHNDIGPAAGLFLQFYEANIAGRHFYFGLQSDIETGRRKGLLFSRWCTQDKRNLRPSDGSWIHTGREGHDYISLRRFFDWGSGEYTADLIACEYDELGRWFSYSVSDRSSGSVTEVGSIRFPGKPGGNVRIEGRGGTWVEVFSRVKSAAEIPLWHVSIDSLQVDDQVARGAECHFDENIPNANIEYDAAEGRIHIWVGGDVMRQRDRYTLF
jgi:hypothetical protein